MKEINVGSKIKNTKNGETRTISRICIHNGYIILVDDENGSGMTDIVGPVLQVVEAPKKFVLFGCENYEAKLGTGGVMGRFSTIESVFDFLEDLSPDAKIDHTFEIVNAFSFGSVVYFSVSEDYCSVEEGDWWKKTTLEDLKSQFSE